MKTATIVAESDSGINRYSDYDINNLYPRLMDTLKRKAYGERHETSRNGFVVSYKKPVVISSSRPKRRVLFDPSRDANPFFHLFESIWMLAGRKDLAPLTHFLSNMENYSDDGETLNGAYGYRWSTQFDIDQIDAVVQRLRKDPFDRRVVIQMWDARNDLNLDSKDVPCNVCILPRIDDNHLDMTVINRSNDIIWGMLGSNFVHFTILQEYLAASLGIEMGQFNQFSTNAHAYVGVLEKLLSKHEERGDHFYNINESDSCKFYDRYPDWDNLDMINDPMTFREECIDFIECTMNRKECSYNNDFFPFTMVPMLHAYNLYKEKRYDEAIQIANSMRATDWRRACVNWLERRKHNHENS